MHHEGERKQKTEPSSSSSISSVPLNSLVPHSARYGMKMQGGWRKLCIYSSDGYLFIYLLLIYKDKLIFNQ